MPLKQFSSTDLKGGIADLGNGIKTIIGIDDPSKRVTSNSAIVGQITKNEPREVLDITGFDQNSNVSKFLASINVSSDVQTPALSGSAEIKASAEKNQGTFAAQYNIMWGFRYKIEKYDEKTDLSEEAKKFLQTHSIEQFIAKYGDSFLFSITLGVIFNATIRFENLTKESKKDLELKLSAHKQASTLASSLKTGGELHKYAASKNIRFHIAITQKGGMPTTSPEAKREEARKKLYEENANKKTLEEDLKKKQEEFDSASKEFDKAKLDNDKSKEKVQKAEKTLGESKSDAEKATAKASLDTATAQAETAAKNDEAAKTKMDIAKKTLDAARAKLVDQSKKVDIATDALNDSEKDLKEESSKKASQAGFFQFSKPDEFSEMYDDTRITLDKIKKAPDLYAMVIIDCDYQSYDTLPTEMDKDIESFTDWVLTKNKNIQKAADCKRSLENLQNILMSDTSAARQTGRRAELIKTIEIHKLHSNELLIKLVKLADADKKSYSELITELNKIIQFLVELNSKKNFVELLKGLPANKIITSSEIRDKKNKGNPVKPSIFFGLIERGRHWYNHPFQFPIIPETNILKLKFSKLPKGTLNFGYMENNEPQVTDNITQKLALLKSDERKMNKEKLIVSAQKEQADAEEEIGKSLIVLNKMKVDLELLKKNIDDLQTELKGFSPDAAPDVKTKKEDEIKNKNMEVIELQKRIFQQENDLSAKQSILNSAQQYVKELSETEDNTVSIPIPEKAKGNPGLLFLFSHEKGEGGGEVEPFTIEIFREDATIPLSPVGRRIPVEEKGDKKGAGI